MPVVDLEPEAGEPEVFGMIIRKQFPQSGPRSTEFGEGGSKLRKIMLNAGLLLLSRLWFDCIL